MKKTYYLLIIIFLNTCLLSSAEEKYTSLIASIDKIRIEENISASYLTIVTSENILLSRTLGKTAHEGGKPFSDNDYIRIGSISKLFTGLSILALESMSDFKIDKPIDHYLEKLPLENPWSPTYKTTTAQFLEHTAGLKGLSKKEFAFNDPVSIEEAFLVDPKSRLLEWPPGLHSAYSNTGAGLAAYVIENITKDKYETFVTQNVFRPLGLSSATYFPEAGVKQSLIVGYHTNGETAIPYWHTLYRAFAGINIQAKEIHRVLQMFLGKGQLQGQEVFTAKMIQRMETPRTTLSAKSGLEYGYGLGLYHYQVKGFPFIGHGGDADGYLAYFAYSRQLDIGYFVMINAFNKRALNKIKREIHKTLIANVNPPSPPPKFTLSNKRINEIKGDYYEATYRFAASEQALKIISEGERLFTLHKGDKLELVPVNEKHFRRQGQTVATIGIVNEGKDSYLQGDIGNFKKQK